MGCGASKEEEPAQAEVAPLTQGEKNAIATAGLKDAMAWALDQAVIALSVEKIWQEQDNVKITVPVQSKIDSAIEKAGGIPLIGGKLVSGLEEATKPFEASFADAGKVVASHPRTRTAFSNVITSIDVADAILLTRQGGVSACVEYVVEKGKASLEKSMVEIVEEVMSEHKLTSVWNSFIENFNSVAGKIPGGAIDPIEFDLNKYVLDKALNGVFVIMMEKEQEIRAAPAQALTLAARQAFGSADPSTWQRQ